MQTKKASFIEALQNIGVKLPVNMLVNQIVFPLVLGVNVSFSNNLEIACIMTVIAIVASFCTRRFFNMLFKNGQNKVQSLIESIGHIVFKIPIRYLTNYFVLPLVLGCYVTVTKNVSIMVLMTGISCFLTYCIRRYNNYKEVKNGFSKSYR